MTRSTFSRVQFPISPASKSHSFEDEAVIHCRLSFPLVGSALRKWTAESCLTQLRQIRYSIGSNRSLARPSASPEPDRRRGRNASGLSWRQNGDRVLGWCWPRVSSLMDPKFPASLPAAFLNGPALSCRMRQHSTPYGTSEKPVTFGVI